MGSVLLFVNENGGVGKSSLIFNTAWEFSKKKKVLIIDLDGQEGNITRFCGVKKNDEMGTMLEVMEDKCPIEEVMVEVKKNLYLVPADNRVVSIKSTEHAPALKKVKANLEELRTKFDLIYFDVSPDPDYRHFISMLLSDYIVIVLEPSGKSLAGILGILNSVKEIRELNPELKIMGFLMNKHKPQRAAKTRDAVQAAGMIASKEGTSVFDTVVNDYSVIDDSILKTQGVTQHSPLSPGAMIIRKLCKEIDKRLKDYGKTK